MSITESDTPRTDAYAAEMIRQIMACEATIDTEIVPARFARQLERELTASRAEVKRLTDKTKQSPAYLSMTQALCDTNKQLRKAKECVELIANWGGRVTDEGVSCNGLWCRDQAQACIAAIG